MKKVLCGLSMVLLLSGCVTNIPDENKMCKTFATKAHADAYAYKMILKGYQVRESKYERWFNHGTYWHAVYVEKKK